MSAKRRQKGFLPFKKARALARGLNLASSTEWHKFCASGKRPPNIPSNPQTTYYADWQNWGDWLGTKTPARTLAPRYTFRPFKAARDYVQKLGLANKREWLRYCASGQRPLDIPVNPQIAYRSEWKDWGEWLGTGRARRQHLSFSEARSIVRDLKFPARAAFDAAAQANALPEGIPKHPSAAYRQSGWQGWGDWLGTFRKSSQEISRGKKPYEEAVEFARSLNLKSKTDWDRWRRSGNRPADMPSNPAEAYKKEGWQGWAQFLGTSNRKSGDVIYRDFEAARAWAQSQNLKSMKEWSALAKSGALPCDIPASPWRVYREQGWLSIGDWLGKGDRDSKRRQWRPFEEAREYVRKLGLKTGREWAAYCKAGNLPSDIPTFPSRVYKELGWRSLGDWLGNELIAPQKRKFLSFNDARAIVHSHRFQTKTEYESWARGDTRPINIPALPSRTYAKSGWRGWGDWIGIHNRWSKTSLLAFVSSIVPILSRFEPSELYAIFRQNGCLNAVDLLPPASPLRRLVDAALREDKDEVENSLRELGFEALDDEEIEPRLDASESDKIADTIVPTLDDDDTELPDLEPVEILSGLDELERSVVLSDAETIEFLITKAVGRIWSRVLKSTAIEDDIAGLRSHKPESYGARVQKRFLAQYDGARSLELPDGYSFRKNGVRVLPNLMQRLVAYRVLTDKRVGNWSGTGAGKTLWGDTCVSTSRCRVDCGYRPQQHDTRRENWLGRRNL